VRSKKSRVSLLAAAAIATALIATPVSAAVAADYSISGDMPYNTTQYYGTFRPHGIGSAYFRLDSFPQNFCGGAFQIALRNSAGDSSNYSTWTSVGGTRAFVWWNGGTVPSGSYAITAKNYGAGCTSHTVYWGGLLTL